MQVRSVPRPRLPTTGASPRFFALQTSRLSTLTNGFVHQDRAGNTPLHLAIESGFAEVAVALIEAGADRERGDQDGYARPLCCIA